MDCGIYKIQNKVNDKVYIGASRTINERFNEHKSTLRNGKHRNVHLQRSWNKYGEDNFEFNTLLYCSEDNLEFYECRAIDQYSALERDSGYNLIKDAACRQLSEETKQKISEAHKGKSLKESTIKKMLKNRPDMSGENHPLYGTSVSEETKNKMSGPRESMTGENNSQAELSKYEVKQIKRLLKFTNKQQNKIADEFNISPVHVCKIKQGERWSHVEIDE